MLFPAQGEGFGLAAAEALMAGVPVVACWDGGGLLDVVPETGAGRLTLPSAEALSDATLDLLQDPDRMALARLVGESWRARLSPDARGRAVRGMVSRGAGCVGRGSGRRSGSSASPSSGSPARSLLRNWTELRSQPLEWRIEPGWLLLSALVVWAMYALLIVAWRTMLAGWGQRLDGWTAARIWTVSSLGKYLPGQGLGDRRAWR